MTMLSQNTSRRLLLLVNYITTMFQRGYQKHRWKSSESIIPTGESINLPSGWNNSLAPAINYIDTKIRLKFVGICLKRYQVAYRYKKVVSIYIIYEENLWENAQGPDFTLGNSLFGAVKLTKNTAIDKYSYSGYGIGFWCTWKFFVIKWQLVW